MSKCRLCNVEILDETERCPLCDSVLEHTFEVENMYPDVRVMAKKWTLLLNIYLFVAILTEALLIYINLHTESQTLWSLITGLSLLYVYIVLRFAIIGKAGYKAKTVVLTVIAILILVLIDFLAGYHGWSVNFVLPGGIIFIEAVIIFMMIFNHRNWQSYLMWQIFTILLNFIPIVLAIVDVITNLYMLKISTALSAGVFLGTVIIGDRKVRVELKRKFHIR